jgi:hypothetical protein
VTGAGRATGAGRVTGTRRVTGTGPAARRRLTDPLPPALVLAPAAVLAAPVLTWAVLGGLAGYSLSGSV